MMENEIDNLLGLVCCLSLLAEMIVYDDASPENNIKYASYVIEIQKEIEDMIERIESKNVIIN